MVWVRAIQTGRQSFPLVTVAGVKGRKKKRLKLIFRFWVYLELMIQMSGGITSSLDEAECGHPFGGVSQVWGLLRRSQRRADFVIQVWRVQHLRLVEYSSAELRYPLPERCGDNGVGGTDTERPWELVLVLQLSFQSNTHTLIICTNTQVPHTWTGSHYVHAP